MLEFLPRPKQMAFDIADRQVQGVGNFLITHVLKVAQFHHCAPGGRQLEQRLTDALLLFRREDTPLGVCGHVADFKIVFQRFSRASALRQIQCEISDDGMQPGGKGTPAVKGRQRIIGAHKSILRHVEGILRVTDNASRDVIGRGLVPTHEFAKGVAVPLQGKRDETGVGLFGQDLHRAVGGADRPCERRAQAGGVSHDTLYTLRGVKKLHSGERLQLFVSMHVNGCKKGDGPMTSSTKSTSILLAPFVWLWQLVTFILGLTGRLLAVLLGFVLLVLGLLVTLTVIGAIIGIPMLIVGFALIVRGLF